MGKAVYAGSFDPLTNGHLWMIKTGSRIFEELIVAIGTNPDKRYTFTLEERLEMLKRSTRQFKNVRIDSFENKFLVDYADSVEAKHILRGIRTERDYGYERGMRYVNNKLNPEVNTLFLIPPKSLTEVSSSLVKGLVGSQGWERAIEDYVPREVYNGFLIKFEGLKSRWDSLWKRHTEFSGDEVYRKLVGMYANKERFYHNLIHIAHSLDEMDTVSALLDKPDEAEFALWYHDSIQDANAKDNEERSGSFAEEQLSLHGINPGFGRDVSNLILATTHRSVPPTKDGKYVADIDLSILGKSMEEFDAYERDIRSEYSWVPEDRFIEGRSAILQKFLSRDRIYATGFFRQKYENQAKKNLERSLKALNKVRQES